ncbi:MAG: hypothetical protein ACK5XN_27555 [Bacteroidota bacterium]
MDAGAIRDSGSLGVCDRTVGQDAARAKDQGIGLSALPHLTLLQLGSEADGDDLGIVAPAKDVAKGSRGGSLDAGFARDCGGHRSGKGSVEANTLGYSPHPMQAIFWALALLRLKRI